MRENESHSLPVYIYIYTPVRYTQSFVQAAYVRAPLSPGSLLKIIRVYLTSRLMSVLSSFGPLLSRYFIVFHLGLEKCNFSYTTRPACKHRPGIISLHCIFIRMVISVGITLLFIICEGYRFYILAEYGILSKSSIYVINIINYFTLMNFFYSEFQMFYTYINVRI